MLHERSALSTAAAWRDTYTWVPDLEIASESNDDRARILALTSWLLILGGACDLSYFVVGFAFGSRDLLVVGVGTLGFLVLVLVARGFARRGRVSAAAMTISYAILATALGVAPFFTYAYPTLVLASLLAICTALPYLHGRSMLAVGVSSVVVAGIVDIVGQVLDPPAHVPVAVRVGVSLGTTMVVVILIAFVLVQFTARLRSTAATAVRAAGTLDAIVTASPASINLLDLDGTVRLWNASSERIFGWSAAEAVGRFNPVVREESRADYLANLAAIAAGTPILGKEARRHRKDGSPVDLELWAAPLRDPDGSLKCVSMALDISARKQAEERARTADRRKDEFLALLGHELRNPLAPIVTALEVMRGRGEKGFERERAVIERQTRHLTRLVDDLLDLSRITQGKIHLRRAKIDIAETVMNAVEMVSPLLEERRHVLDLHVPRGELWVDGDPERLAQVVANLLSNAGRYTESGGHIRIIGERDGEQVRLVVEDDGLGIDRDFLPELFAPFSQAPRTRASGTGGLGLGLTLVKSLVELHGGRVEAHSDGPQRGSRFVVSLPSSAAHDGRASAAFTRTEGEGGAARVLLVDDNPDAVEMLAELLTDRGCTVATAYDGPAALEVARTFMPEVAVLDIGLPVMDGYELCRRLRSDAGGKALRFVFALTGYGQDDDQKRAIEAGFDVHFVKPVDPATLLAAIKAERSTAKVGA